MANSLDDMLKAQLPKKKKAGPRIFIFLIMLIVIALIGAFVYIKFFQKKDEFTPKMAFVQYLGKANFVNVLNLEKMNAFGTRLQSESQESTTEISGTISNGIIESELDLSELKVQLDSKSDVLKKKATSDIILKYKDNEMLKFNILSNNDRVGIISEDIVVKYLGSKYSNLMDVLNKYAGDEVGAFPEIDIEKLRNEKFSIPVLSNEMFTKYIDIISQKVQDSAFSSQEVALDNIPVTEYTMKLTESQVIEILDMMLRTLEQDNELLDILLASFGDDAQSIKETINSQIEVFVNSLYSKTPDNNKIYTVKVYGANDIVYKVSLDMYGKYSADISYSIEDTKNSVTVTLLENETQSGYSVDIVKTSSEVSENFDVTLNKVEEENIVGKINFVYDLVASGNKYTLKNKLDINIMGIVVTLQANSEINFKDVSVKNLTEENCLFLDELDKEQFDNVVEAVKTRTEEVIDEKLIALGIRKKAEEVNTFLPPATINTEEQKEAAKNKLINAVSEEMGKATEEGRTYSLIDLMVLEIPNTMISVSIENDIATINIDGFEFKLNSEFQLYE